MSGFAGDEGAEGAEDVAAEEGPADGEDLAADDDVAADEDFAAVGEGVAGAAGATACGDGLTNPLGSLLAQDDSRTIPAKPAKTERRLKKGLIESSIASIIPVLTRVPAEKASW